MRKDKVNIIRMLPPVDIWTINYYKRIQGLTGYALDLLNLLARNVTM